VVDVDTRTGASRVKARSSRRIVDAARDLLDAEGTDALSMRRLAEHADVSVRTIYNLFGDKQGVFEALVRESFDAMHAGIGALGATDPIERIWEAVALSVQVNCRYVPRAVIAAVVVDDDLQRELASHWPGRDLVFDAIQAATTARALRADVTPDALVAHAGAVFLHLLWSWSQERIDEAALTAGALHAFDLCLLAVATPRTRTRLLEHMASLDPHLSTPA
jgi:AcrR family transcriptional regulator